MCSSSFCKNNKHKFNCLQIIKYDRHSAKFQKLVDTVSDGCFEPIVLGHNIMCGRCKGYVLKIPCRLEMMIIAIKLDKFNKQIDHHE